MWLLTSKQLKDIIAKGEGLKLDFKREFSEEVIQDFTKDFAAFANAEGGTIVGGVTNSKEILGSKAEPGTLARVYQEATYCVPPVNISAYELTIGKVKVLVVEVPKSTYIHCDKKRRFPQRLGDRTDFMETQMILSLARARNLIGDGSEFGLNQNPWVRPRKSATKEDRESVSRLSHANDWVRLAAIQDLHAAASNHRIEEIHGFWEAINSRLRDENSEIRRGSLVLLDSMVNQFQSNPVRIANRGTLETIAHLALEDPEQQVKVSAFQLMCWLGKPEYLPTIIKLIIESPKVMYQGLNVQYNLSHLSRRRLWSRLRNSLYSRLETSQDKEVQARILDLLQLTRSLTLQD